MEIEFVDPGFYTTLQAERNFSQLHFGVPSGGPMDRHAAKFANLLVGNESSNPVLECVLRGPKIRIDRSATNIQMAVTGAATSIMFDGSETEMNNAFDIGAGSLVEIGSCKKGFRIYIAFSGLMKRAHPTNSLKIERREQLSLTSQECFATKAKLEPMIYDNVVEVAEGPEADNFSREAIARFFGRTYTVLPDSGRIAYVLKSSGLKHSVADMISSPVIPGTIQLLPSGTPLVLMRDCQTIGGYPRIGTVTENGLNKLSQIRPGEKIGFRVIEN